MQSQKKKKTSLPKAEAKIDLHGFTVEVAYQQCKSKLQAYYDREYSTVEVITGKSGQIRAEFPFWLENWGYRGQVLPGNGSFLIYL